MQQYIREESSPYGVEETLAAGVARGRLEEHQRICKMMRRLIVEITDVRFPLIATFIQERVERIEHFAVLHQFAFIVGTAWTPEDVLRFVIALDDAQEGAR